MNPANIVMGFALAALLCATPVWAGDDHGHDGAPSPTTGPALPRFSAVSETFELVGVVDGQQLSVYLDRFEDNTPVKNARVDLDVGGEKVTLQQRADGEYAGTLAQGLEPGVIVVTASVAAGGESDILTGDLDLHEESVPHAEPASSGRRYAAVATGAVAVLCAVVWALRRRGGVHAGRTGGAA